MYACFGTMWFVACWVSCNRSLVSCLQLYSWLAPYSLTKASLQSCSLVRPAKFVTGPKIELSIRRARSRIHLLEHYRVNTSLCRSRCWSIQFASSSSFTLPLSTPSFDCTTLSLSLKRQLPGTDWLVRQSNRIFPSRISGGATLERSSRVDPLPRHRRGSRICSGYQPLGSVLLPQRHDCQRQQDASGSALDAHDDWMVLLRCRSLHHGAGLHRKASTG